MFRNYLTVALRNFTKYKGYTAINITGLALGAACFLMIILYVQHELSYDAHHEKADRIYRIGVNGRLGDNAFSQVVTAAPMAEALLNEFPEVENVTRFRSFGFPVVRYEDKVFSEERFYWADSSFFSVFTAPFLKGDPQSALTEPNSVVLTESMARKYFGESDPLGKSLNTDNRRDYRVTAVIADPPETSHFQYDFLGSLNSYEDGDNSIWVSHNYYTYVLLREGSSPEALTKKLQTLVTKYVGPQIEQFLGVQMADLLAQGSYFNYFAQPLRDIHLHSDYDYEIGPNGDSAYVYIFLVIALAILLIACINFMNLATARSARRAREVGIRKTLGSLRGQLIGQFLAESVLMTYIAFAVAVLLVEFTLPWFSLISGKPLAIDYLNNPRTIPGLFFVATIVGVLAGVYPAFFLANFKPVKTLRANYGRSSNSWLRNGLVIFQFAISITLFIGAFIVHDQLNFIQNKKLGFNKDQVLVIRKTDDLGEKRAIFSERLRGMPGIRAVSNSTTLPGENFGSNTYHFQEAPETDNLLLWTIWTDEHFEDTYQIEMAGGRYFSAERSTDTSAVVINETAAAQIGMKNPVGKTLIQSGRTPEEGRPFTIIGVMKDFHFESLHRQIRPMLVHLFPQRFGGRNISIRLAAGDIPETLTNIKSMWHEYAGNQAFEYIFFDRHFAQIYESEQQTGKLLDTFSILAIIIACLGLFGLASFTTEQRTKEIGVRKVMGATVSSIILLLCKDFARFVLIANLIAWPAAYFLARGWLQNFAYRTDIRIEIFLLAALLALAAALVTVGYQTTKAALRDPVKSLRYE